MSRILVALDGMSVSQAIVLADKLQGYVHGFKFNDLLIDEGAASIVRLFHRRGAVMLDYKFHDIPNTVVNQVRHCAALGAEFVTVHASGGIEMMLAAVTEALHGHTKVLAITALTSLNDVACRCIYGTDARNCVRRLMDMANQSGVHGVVCSPQEEDLALEVPNLIKVVPGVRLPEDKQDDQARTGIPAWADLVVIGRPITKAADPVAAAMKFNTVLEKA